MEPTQALEEMLTDIGAARHGDRVDVEAVDDGGSHIAADGSYIQVDCSFPEEGGLDLEPANQLRTVVDIHDHEDAHYRYSDLRSKERIAEEYRMTAPKMAGAVANILEDQYVNAERVRENPGRRRTRALTAKCVMASDDWSPPLGEVDGAGQYVEGLKQLAIGGYVKGFDDAPPKVRAFLRDVEADIDAVRVEDDPDARLDIAREVTEKILDSVQDQHNLDPDDLPDGHATGAVPKEAAEEMEDAAEDAGDQTGGGDLPDVEPEAIDWPESQPDEDATDDDGGDAAGGEQDPDADAAEGGGGAGGEQDDDVQPESEGETGGGCAGEDDEDGAGDPDADSSGESDAEDAEDDGAGAGSGDEQDADAENGAGGGGDGEDAPADDGDAPDAGGGDGDGDTDGDGDADDDAGSPGRGSGGDGQGPASGARQGDDDGMPDLSERDEDSVAEKFDVDPEEVERVSASDRARFTRYQRRLEEFDTDIERRRRERDERVEDTRAEAHADNLHNRARKAGVIEEVEERFMEYVTRDQPRAAVEGTRLDKRNTVRRVAGDVGQQALYQHHDPVETGDRTIGVALDISGSMSGDMKPAKIALAAVAKACETIGDTFTATAYTDHEDMYRHDGEPMGGAGPDADSLDLRLITGPEEDFRWEQLASVHAKDRTPTASGIKFTGAVMDECQTTKEELLVVITDGKANITIDGRDVDHTSDEPIEDCAAEAERQRENGRGVVGIGIGAADERLLEQTFGEGNWVCSSINTLADDLIEVYESQLDQGAVR